VAWWWYAVVLLGPVAFAFAAAAVGVLLARPWATVEPRMLTGGWPDVLIFLLVLVITDGLGEEIAWRGYALPRMLARFSPALASLGLGAFWWFWHLPLLLGRGAPLTGTPVWLLLGDLLAMSVIVTAVFLHTRGSVLLAVLLHASTNLAAVSPRVGPEGDLLLPLVVLSMKVVLAAVILAAPGALPDPRGSDSEATFPPAEPRER
ncbi:MAG TPA: CPBP family intramembrane glutamic endopeptidase, partial [Microlunatus sp.]|nr:CPBP family intramembrane glutamic endopeptidase [Microlunatus sp.]